MRTLRLDICAVVLLATAACSREQPAPATPAATPAAAPPAAAAPLQSEPVFTREELDQMVAPIALYPDPLLAQVLMAATYPGDVSDAVAWSKAHPDARGDAAVKQVAEQPWDPSVQSLVAFPQALATLGQDPAWVQRLGDAFLAQPDEVMDAVQRLRQQAQTAGNLESNEYQNVSVEPPAPQVAPAVGAAGGTTVVESAPSTIVIQPADPEVVYVPSYNPTTVYGTWAYPSYPPAYYPPPPGYYAGNALVSGLAFGVGVAITDSLWGGFDWNDDDIDINVNRYNNINVNRQIDVNQNTWRHNPANRDGVPYRDRANREFNSRRLDGADQRAAFRGGDAQRAQAREQARASMQKHGVDAPARNNQEARDRAQAAARDRDRTQPGAAGSRDQARDRAQAATERTQARDRAQGAAQRASPQTREHAQAARAKAHTAAQSHPQAASKAKARQAQSNSHARTAARSQAQHHQAPRNNAFQGASKPHASKAAAQRGHASHAAAKRPAASRPAGKPVQRPSHPPQQRHAARRR
ncbi:uncharacterized protein DUF3300 [Luteimonas cucumeris]|uniref:Uncharacterized protein DUF3300 n=1 Tax=Luteimonas cucumeris TaxID=985012 RepID=A0A562KX89_9GAMM|nr:DUF3300 domain-containing protein [Luteimonas cucumeris]TWI00003.1 uncharacterized protein DUF3300 [Luteimonas cucumeris]